MAAPHRLTSNLAVKVSFGPHRHRPTSLLAPMATTEALWMLPTKLSHLANKLVHLRTPLGVRTESKSDHRRESREERLEGADVPDSCPAPSKQVKNKKYTLIFCFVFC